MERLFTYIILLIIFSSCSESFKSVNPSDFNERILHVKSIDTAEDLIKLYYNYPADGGTSSIEITQKEKDDGFVEITLIHFGQQDDSQRATKIVMTAKFTDGVWYVQKIKTNRKCYDGRGHTGWGTEWCN